MWLFCDEVIGCSVECEDSFNSIQMLFFEIVVNEYMLHFEYMTCEGQVL